MKASWEEEQNHIFLQERPSPRDGQSMTEQSNQARK